MLKTLWTQYLAPILRRPPRYQVAALCYRRTGDVVDVLLVTSLHTRRWILPKGWPKHGLDAAGVALDEAWEEAGVTPEEGPYRRLGRYGYTKRLRGGVPAETEVDVYAIPVAALAEDYPECARRERRWMAPADAAALVDEPELQSLLRRVPERLDAAAAG